MLDQEVHLRRNRRGPGSILVASLFLGLSVTGPAFADVLPPIDPNDPLFTGSTTGQSNNIQSTTIGDTYTFSPTVISSTHITANRSANPRFIPTFKTPADFGILVPQDRTSMHIRLELIGRDKVNVHGSQRDLMKLNLTTEEVVWSLWVDDTDHFKLVRVEIPADNTEVVRD